jgi:hypothetical protein
MRIFVFGIGGTGARVLRSLAILLASGVKFREETIEVIPVIVDMDAHNGDTGRTRELFRNYYTIRKTFTGASQETAPEGFFNTRIRSFNKLEAGSADSADLDMQFDFQNRNDTFSKFIHFNGLDKLNQDLLELLYNDATEDKDFPELHLNLSLGFKGNPNIGSVVFNQLMTSQQFKNLEGSFNERDRVFIVSSIFGGTGSSGFPTLVKLIRQSRNPNLAGTKLGAITVMPYFNVEPKDESAINSSLFNTKTKAALSYYSDDSDIRSVNALYYIADSDQAGHLNNVEGGREQMNNSHLVELISATAIVDFIDKEDHELTEPRCFEYGTHADSNPFTIAGFSTQTKERCIKPLIRFAYAAQIATSFIPRLKDNTFYKPKELDLDVGMGIPGEYGKLLAFFESFKKWGEEEMSSPDNGRAFNSFIYRDSEHLNNLVCGKEIKTGLFNKGLTLNKVAEHLNNFETREPKDLALPQKYMNMLYKTANECLNVLGQLP